MKINSSRSPESAAEALRVSGFASDDGTTWNRPGHWLCLDADQVPLTARVEAGGSGCEVEIRPAFPRFHGQFGRRVAEVLLQQFDRDDEVRLMDQEPDTLSGGFATLFFRLSSVFLGLLGVLIVLAVFLRVQLGGLAKEFAPRVAAFQTLLEDSGVPVPAFPDIAWIESGFNDSLWGGALVLSFILTFLVGSVPLISMMLLRRSLTPGLFLLLAGLWGGLMAWQGRAGGAFDALMWLVSPLAVLPGYLLVNSWRSVRVVKAESRSMLWPAAVYSVLIFVSWMLLFSPAISLPRKAGEALPDVTSAESMLVIRDEVLKRSSLGRRISDGYYNNVVASNQYLRPPLSIRWTDSTVLTCGLGEDWSKALLAEHRVVCEATPESLPGILAKGLERDGVLTGRGGFEILLVDRATVGEDFEKRVAEADPDMLSRYVIVDGRELVNPRLTKHFSDYERRRPDETTKVSGLMKKALYAVQTANDRTVFREEARGGGLFLIKAVGLPLLMLWAMSGLLHLMASWRRSAGRKVLAAGSLILVVWPLGTYWAAERAGPEAYWIHERSRTAEFFNRLWAIEREHQVRTPAAVQQLVRMERELQSWWNDGWLEGFNRLDELSPAANARAWAALHRTLESLIVYDQLWLRYNGVPPNIVSPKQWNAVQRGPLKKALEHPDPVVKYWALKCCLYADLELTDLWDRVIACLRDPSLNVRDRASETLSKAGRVDYARALLEHYRERGSLETCDYVRFNQFWQLYMRRRALSQ